MPRTFVHRLLLVVVAVCVAATGRAQIPTAVTGSVVDPQGAAIPHARVSIYPPGSASPITAQADDKGVYRVALPSGGTYIVEVEAEGFRNNSLVVVVPDGEGARQDFSLEIGGVSSSVVVTANGAAQTVDQISKAVSVIESKEILDRGEYNVHGILSTVPGIQLSNNGGPGQFTQIRMRGLRPDATAILIDGMRFRDASASQGDATGFLSTMNFVAADRVEVLRGSGSSLYGTNAAGGVVNIVSDEGGGPLHGIVQSEAGNLGLFRTRATVGGSAASNRLKFNVGIMQLNVTKGLDGDDKASSTGGQGAFRFDLTPKTFVSGRFLGSNNFVQLDVPGPTVTGVPRANVPETGIVQAIALAPDQVLNLQAGRPVDFGKATFIPNRDDPDNRRNAWSTATAVRLQHQFSSASNVETTYQRVRTNLLYRNGTLGGGSQPPVETYLNLVGDIDTANARFNFPFGRWNRLTGGYEFEHEQYYNLSDNNLPGIQRVRSETSIGQHSHAGFVQDQLSFLDNRLQLSVSGRAQIYRLERPEFNYLGITTNYDKVALVAPPSALTGDVSLSYFMAPTGTKLRTHLGNAYRAPGLPERFGGGFSGGVTGTGVFSPNGDPFLDPDRYNSADGGVDQYLWGDRVRVASTYFYTRIVSVTAFDSGVVINPKTDPYGRTQGYINGSGGVSQGAELSVDSRPTRDLKLAGSYTYTHATTDKDVDVAGFFETLRVARHTFTLMASQQIGRRLNVTMDLAGKGQFYGSFSAFGRPRVYLYPQSARMDLSASYLLRQADHSGLKLYTRVENIFDRTYYDGNSLVGYRLPGLTFATGVSVQY